MTDQAVNPLDTINPLDSGNRESPEIGPSGEPVVRTEEGIVTEGSQVNWDKRAILWALPQPLLVAGSVLLVAAMVAHEWGGEYYRLWTCLLYTSPSPRDS